MSSGKNVDQRISEWRPSDSNSPFGGRFDSGRKRMVAGVVGPGCEFPNSIRNLDRETVVKVASQNKDGFAKRIPEFDQLFALSGNRRPGLIFIPFFQDRVERAGPSS